MSIETIESIELREGTTRYISLTCKAKETGEPFDFSGFTVQTYLSFGAHRQYVDTAIIDNVVSYKIPAEVSIGAMSGVAETRIFKDGDVYEIMHINVFINKAEKPDIIPRAQN